MKAYKISCELLPVGAIIRGDERYESVALLGLPTRSSVAVHIFHTYGSHCRSSLVPFETVLLVVTARHLYDDQVDSYACDKPF